MDFILEVVKKQILDQLEEEKNLIAKNEHMRLVNKAMELIGKIKSRLGAGGDIFFRAGIFLA